MIAFIAFVVLSAKAWHWVNIVFLSLCFLTAVGVIYAAAKVLDARRTQMVKVQKTAMDLDLVEKRIEQTVYGSGLSFEYDPESLRGLSQSLSLEKAGRGRVWKNGVVAVQDSNRVFNFTGERVLNPDNPNALKDVTMFVFADRNFKEELYPVLFVGIMKVASESASALTLEPVFIADAGEYQTPSNSWTLFEKPPTDMRDAFIRDTGIEIKEDDPKLNENLTEYRKVLTEQYIPAEVFGIDLANDDNARKYEAIIDRVMFDGLPLVRIESWIEAQTDRFSNRFDPSNEEIFVRYQFNEKSNRQYEVDASGNIESDGQFNKNGQAINPALHAGGNVEFQKGDEIYVDQLTADGFQRGDEPVPPFSSTEPVTEISRIYRRQLNDYTYLLRRFDRQNQDYTAEIDRIKLNNERSRFAIDESAKQIQERENLARLLQEDISKFENDVQVINGFLDQTRDSQALLKSSIERIESEIRWRHRQVKASAKAMRGGSSTVAPGPILSAPLLSQPIQSQPILSQPILSQPFQAAPFDNIQAPAPGQQIFAPDQFPDQSIIPAQPPFPEQSLEPGEIFDPGQ